MKTFEMQVVCDTWKTFHPSNFQANRIPWVTNFTIETRNIMNLDNPDSNSRSISSIENNLII